MLDFYNSLNPNRTPNSGGERLDFHGFLRLMRWMVEVNFANINNGAGLRRGIMALHWVLLG